MIFLTGCGFQCKFKEMARMVKFSSKLRPELLEELRAFAKTENRHFAHVLDEAVERFLAEARIRPAFEAALQEVLDEHGRLFGGLDG